MIREDYLLFSIIVPVYNNETDLKRCIDSILAQSYRYFELILVDDGSTDGSPQICDWFASRDNRVKVIHKKNNGVVSARNDGLFHALGKYIYFVDGDDWIDKKLLEKASQEFEKEDPPDIFAFCYIQVQDNRYIKRKLKIKAGLYNKIRLEKEVYPDMICKLGKTIQDGIDSGSLCDKIIAKTLLEKHYCKDTSLFRGEDSVCAWECMYYANKIFFSELAMYYYNRLSVSSNQKKYHVDLLENNKAVAQYLRLHLEDQEGIGINLQINALEFGGMVRVIRQEIQFKHSIYFSAHSLKKKLRHRENSFICSGAGLPFTAQLYIFFLNRRYFYSLLIYEKVKSWFYTISFVLTG